MAYATDTHPHDALPCNEVMSVAPQHVTLDIDTGAHRVVSVGHRIGASDSTVESPETGTPSREGPEVGPEPELAGLTEDELLRLAWRQPGMQAAVRAEMERRDAGPAA
jgi:hypothetical protein